MVRSGSAAAGVAVGLTPQARAQEPAGKPGRWGYRADVVVVGAGAAGFSAAIRAREAGASVILVEAQPDVGGRAICSGGHVSLGGGTSKQRAHGIEDTPDLVFDDLTDWSIVQANGSADYRYNDREVIRAFADNCADAFEFLVEHGVVFVDVPPDGLAGTSVGNSMPRQNKVAVMDWPMVQTGQPAPPEQRQTLVSGNGLIRPLEAAASKLGVRILLEHRMTALHRDRPPSGKVAGIVADARGRTVNIRANRAVVLAAGGFQGNVNFRRILDPRLTEEYCGVAGEPWAVQDASGMRAAMAVGATLWGTYNHTAEFGTKLTKPGNIGTQFGYLRLRWLPGSPVFDRARATGLQVGDWQDVITVNMLGRRFYDETGGTETMWNHWGQVDPYTHGSYLNARDIEYRPDNWINAAMQGFGDGSNGGGPIWAIFDADAVKREGWDPRPPNVDLKEGFFFESDSIGALAKKIKMRYQRVAMAPGTLEETVRRYNAFVDSGVDEDFGKPSPRHKIAKPPFYAAWATPVPHDSCAGIRINGKGEVIDLDGEAIDGLYSCGENAGGFGMHGLGRAICQGYIAGKNAAGVAARSAGRTA